MAHLLSLLSYAVIVALLIPSAVSDYQSEAPDPSNVRKGAAYLRSLCKDNIRPHQCWRIIGDVRHWDDFFYAPDANFRADVSIKLTREKAVEILDSLKHLQKDSHNNELKRKYKLCVKNYKNVIRDLDQAKTLMDTGNTGLVVSQIHTAMDDFKECRHSFDGASFDPSHVMNRNKELLVFAQLAKATAEEVQKILRISPSPSS